MILSLFLLDTNEKVWNSEKTLFFQQNGFTFTHRAYVLQMWYSEGYSEIIKVYEFFSSNEWNQTGYSDACLHSVALFFFSYTEFLKLLREWKKGVGNETGMKSILF